MRGRCTRRQGPGSAQNLVTPRQYPAIAVNIIISAGIIPCFPQHGLAYIKYAIADAHQCGATIGRDRCQGKPSVVKTLLCCFTATAAIYSGAKAYKASLTNRISLCRQE